MRRKSILVLLLVGYCNGLFVSSAKGEIVNIVYSDGQVHIIDLPMIDTRVIVDGNLTTVDVVEGGFVFDFDTWGNSRGILSGGAILNNLTARQNSQVEVTGGTIGEPSGPGGEFCAYDDSQIMVSGGTMNLLEANGLSQATISGGTIGISAARESGQLTVYGGDIHDLVAFEYGQVTVYGLDMLQYLITDNEGIITIHGSEFYDDIQQIGCGTITSLLNGDWQDEPERFLGIRFDNGDFIGTTFYIGHNASIVLVPEPSMLLFLSLGAVIAKRRENRNPLWLIETFKF